MKTKKYYKLLFFKDNMLIFEEKIVFFVRSVAQILLRVCDISHTECEQRLT